MTPYASRTGTRRNLLALQAHGWGLLVEPSQLGRYTTWPPVWPDGSPARYMVDNGAWGCFQAGTSFDHAAFLRLLDLCGAGADAVVAPDIVAGGLASLDLSLSYIDRLKVYGRPILIPVQNGMQPHHLPRLSAELGIFIGGDTSWKIRTAMAWGRLAAASGAPCHMARVNSERRIHLAVAAGCTSIDGTSCTRFAVNVPRLTHATRALALFTSSPIPTPDLFSWRA